MLARAVSVLDDFDVDLSGQCLCQQGEVNVPGHSCQLQNYLVVRHGVPISAGAREMVLDRWCEY